MWLTPFPAPPLRREIPDTARSKEAGNHRRQASAKHRQTEGWLAESRRNTSCEERKARRRLSVGMMLPVQPRKRIGKGAISCVEALDSLEERLLVLPTKARVPEHSLRSHATSPLLMRKDYCLKESRHQASAKFDRLRNALLRAGGTLVMKQ